jgi:hypothetical protein
MGRLGTPEDIGNVVALFCSEQAGWITGQVIYADGGASLMAPEVPPEIQSGLKRVRPWRQALRNNTRSGYYQEVLRLVWNFRPRHSHRIVLTESACLMIYSEGLAS